MSEGNSFTRSGVVRHACRHRVTAPRPAAGQARGFLFWGILSHTRERPATHAAAGAAARGGLIFVWGIVSHARSLGTTQNCFIRAVALCPAKRRFAFSPMGSHARLAAEIPDIFIPLARNENSGMTTGGRRGDDGGTTGGRRGDDGGTTGGRRGDDGGTTGGRWGDDSFTRSGAAARGG